MPDFIDMTPQEPIPDYPGIIKQVSRLRAEADSCNRLAATGLTVGSLTAGAAWTFATATSVRWAQGAGTNIAPEWVIGATIAGLGLFLFGWSMCGNFQRKSISLRLQADLAMAQRDVAMNSFRQQQVVVQSVVKEVPVEIPVVKPVRPASPTNGRGVAQLAA